jgi:hypothetical protein
MGNRFQIAGAGTLTRRGHYPVRVISCLRLAFSPESRPI